jgi:hypothetical protein
MNRNKLTETYEKAPHRWASWLFFLSLATTIADAVRRTYSRIGATVCSNAPNDYVVCLMSSQRRRVAIKR